MKKNIFPLEPEHYYHIYNRGINGGRIFFNNENYHYFLKLLKEKATSIANFYSYCLLPNHFHFLVKIKSEKEIRNCFPEKEEIEISKLISQQFSNTFNSYTQGINKHFTRTGKLFELPFRRKLLLTDEYLTRSILYIHNNPKKHSLENNIFQYPYSSIHSIIVNDNSFVKSKYVLDLFEDLENFKAMHENYLP